MSPQEVIAEYDAWLDRVPDTPAKRWCLENPPGAFDALWAIQAVRRQADHRLLADLAFMPA